MRTVNDNVIKLDPAMLAGAEAALAALSADYLRWARKDMDKLTAAMAALRHVDAEDWDDAAALVHAVAHNIKGQGSTFGYPLLTHLAGTLCALLRDVAAGEAAGLARLEAVTAAMAEILTHRLSGDGGERGRKILGSLNVQMPALSPEG